MSVFNIPRFKLYFSFAALLLCWCCVQAQARERVLDRVVHVEPEVLEVPDVPRLETGLELTEKRVDVGDAMLHVEEEGTGMPLVLINGGPGGTHHYFHPWFSRAAGYSRVIYYDQRGTGLSGFTPGVDGYSVEQAVADLDAMRIALGIDKWVLLGYSYGGFLAQYYATIHPEKVAGLVLVGAHPGLWVDLGDSRQYDYLTDAETGRMRAALDELRKIREQEGWSREQFLQRALYNNFVNGDWKRQNFYKPTPEEFVYIARYEWVNDNDFNGVMNRSADKVNLAGAFDESPLPALLLEGRWDLTWGEEKPGILSRNHPNGRMVVIDDAGHSIFSENPDAFFDELAGFVRTLKPVTDEQVDAYRRHLDEWRSDWQGSPRFTLRAAGPGKSGSEQIMASFTPGWLEQLQWPFELSRVGFALYDTKRYRESFDAFVRLERVAERDESKTDRAMALIWQGHTLDLLDRREDALGCYQQVVDMDLQDGTSHSQYDMAYDYSAYAAERLEAPFERVENSLP
jgi:pimeloyl-ACP methyl ester carboxylesterase